MCRNVLMTSLFWAKSCEKDQHGRGGNNNPTDAKVKVESRDTADKDEVNILLLNYYLNKRALHLQSNAQGLFPIECIL